MKSMTLMDIRLEIYLQELAVSEIILRIGTRFNLTTFYIFPML